MNGCYPCARGCELVGFSAGRHDGLRYGFGETRFQVSEHVAKIGLSMVRFAKDIMPWVIEPGGLEGGERSSGDLWKWGFKMGLRNFLLSKNRRTFYCPLSKKTEHLTPQLSTNMEYTMDNRNSW